MVVALPPLGGRVVRVHAAWRARHTDAAAALQFRPAAGRFDGRWLSAAWVVSIPQASATGGSEIRGLTPAGN